MCARLSVCPSIAGCIVVIPISPIGRSVCMAELSLYVHIWLMVPRLSKRPNMAERSLFLPSSLLILPRGKIDHRSDFRKRTNVDRCSVGRSVVPGLALLPRGSTFRPGYMQFDRYQCCCCCCCCCSCCAVCHASHGPKWLVPRFCFSCLCVDVWILRLCVTITVTEVVDVFHYNIIFNV